MNDRDLDALLDDASPRPPTDFVARVMNGIAREHEAHAGPATSRLRLVRSAITREARRPWRERVETTCRRVPQLLRWSLIAVGGVVGVAQSASFGLGLWLATAVG